MQSSLTELRQFYWSMMVKSILILPSFFLGRRHYSQLPQELRRSRVEVGILGLVTDINFCKGFHLSDKEKKSFQIIYRQNAAWIRKKSLSLLKKILM
jgi:hypothetical protein